MTVVDLVGGIGVDPIEQSLEVVRPVQEDLVVVVRYSIAVGSAVEDTGYDWHMAQVHLVQREPHLQRYFATHLKTIFS